MAKIIISCAVTGAIHTPSMSEHLPITPEQIAAESIAAAEAGAAIIHLHARDPIDGRPTPDPAVFMAFLPRIKQSTDAVVNITTGGGLGMTLDERLAAPLLASPEVWVSMSCTVISRDAGTSRWAGGSRGSTRIGLTFSSTGVASTATFISLNAGIHLDIGSVGRISPSSIIIIVATPNTGFVELIMIKTLSSVMALLLPTSARPWA